MSPTVAAGFLPCCSEPRGDTIQYECRPFVVVVSQACLRRAAVGRFCVSPALAATTTYDTNNTPYTGGTIDPGDTVLLNDGATVTGNITDNGTLQFNQSAGNTLTISNTFSGTGTLSLTNSGTLNLTGTSAAANTIVLDMTTIASAGLLQIRSGTGLLYLGNGGTGTLNVNGGSVTSPSTTISAF